jgi:hypothetical protein
MSCDPLNEICPEQYGEADKSGAPRITDGNYIYEVAPYTMMWGGAVLGMLGFSEWINVRYQTDITDDHLRFPDRTYTAGVTDKKRYDIDWALATPEIVAWSETANIMMVIYGFGFCSWFANIALDNNGGNFHEIFWRVSQAFKVVPIIQAYLFWKVMTAYSFNYNSEYKNRLAETTEKQNRSVMFRRYATEGSNGLDSGGVVDQDVVSAQWFAFLSFCLITVVQSSAYPHIAQHFHEARYEADFAVAVPAEEEETQ